MRGTLTVKGLTTSETKLGYYHHKANIGKFNRFQKKRKPEMLGFGGKYKATHPTDTF